jgi:tRNA dimethylallyltransferase
VGPTASGKTAVAVALAAELADVEIVTVDSMQVYRGMDIGTAKPAPAERGGVPHHLLDVADPDEEWTVTRWAVAARAAVADIEARGRRALLVGGTGLYVQALVDGLTPPPPFPTVAAELAAETDTAALHERLARLDPVAAGRIQPTNRRRVLRALEVTLGSGRPFSASGPGLGAYPPTRWRLAGLWGPRARGAARIQARFEAMLDAGFLDEVKALAARPAGLSRTARQALGYRELLAHVEAGADLDAAVDLAVRRTRAFARRQRVWWRRDPRIRWYGAADNPLAVIPALLGEWRRP